MAGTLEPVLKGFMTPKEQIRGYKKPASTEYSAARSVKGSPFETLSVQQQAEFQSSREEYEKNMLLAAREKASEKNKGGMIREKTKKTRRRVKKAHKKAVETGLLGSTAPVGGGFWDVYQINVVKDGNSLEDHIYDDMAINSRVSLGNLFNMLDSHPGSHVNIKKTDRMGNSSSMYRFGKLDLLN
jgi:hypothetical protein